MTAFVAYYRVSIDKQGRSGLGLEGQRQAVSHFVSGSCQLIAEFTEVESTRSQRPQLDAVLDAFHRHKATLLIARLGRLARNVAFISNFREGCVDFVAADMPQANRLTIHILAPLAEHERENTSKRTKAALAAAKMRGVTLGNPNPLPASHTAVQVRKENAAAFRARARPLIHDLQERGVTTLFILAEELNARKIPIVRSGLLYVLQLCKIF